MIGGVIDQKANQLIYCMGGHLPLPVLFTDGKARYLEGRGLPVGLFDTAVYENHQLDLPAAFSLSLFSDGIFDVLPGATLKDKEAVLPQLVAAAGGTLEGLKQTLGLANLGEMPDDIALTVLSRNLA